MERMVQYDLSCCIQVCGCEFAHSAIGLCSLAHKSSNNAMCRAEVKACFECYHLGQISSCRESHRQACRSARRMKAHSRQHSTHECGNTRCHLKCAWHIAIDKDAIVHLARGRT